MSAVDIDLLKATLVSLKLGAEAKRFDEQPRGAASAAGFLFSCCIENCQLVLGVSLLEDLMEASQLYSVIVEVFGEAKATYQRRYPKRGYTTLFCWPA